MKKLVINLISFVWSKICYEVEVNGTCYKEIKPIYKLYPAGKTKDGILTEGYSPIGAQKSFPCPDGTFAFHTGLYYPWQCKKCPPGIVCKNGEMSLCSPDLPTSEPGASSPDDCLECKNGYKCFAGKRKELCPHGQKRNLNYKKTPYQLTINLSGKEEPEYLKEIEIKKEGWNDYFCEDCKPGEYCQTGAVVEDMSPILPDDKFPRPCPEGSYNPYVSRTECIPCNFGLGEFCPVGASTKTDIPTSVTCLKGQPKFTDQFSIVDVINRNKCIRKCKKDKFCVGFHWDEIVRKCILKHFGETVPLYREQVYKNKFIAENSIPAGELERFHHLMNQSEIEFSNYTEHLTESVEIIEDLPVVIGLQDVNASIFGGDEHKITLLAADFSSITNFVQISFDNGLVIRNNEDIRAVQEAQLPVKGKFNYKWTSNLLTN